MYVYKSTSITMQTPDNFKQSVSEFNAEQTVGYESAAGATLIHSRASNPVTHGLRMTGRGNLRERLQRLVATESGDDPLINRQIRRQKERDWRRKLRKGLELTKTYSPVMRATALACILSIVYHLVLPGPQLMAQTFQEFDDFSRTDVERFMDRADRKSDVNDWNNYVDIGIATEYVEWENDALEKLNERFEEIADDDALDNAQKELERDAARALFNAAAIDWEADAEDLIYERRGEWRALQEDLDVVEIDPAEYEAAVAQAEADLAAVVELDLNSWDTLVSAALQNARDAFEAELNAKISTAESNNAAISGDERIAFEQELLEREQQIRSEFLLRDNFYVLRARNQ
ncbi:MAG: hypothetical protein KDK30_17410, partial [Leptospiraceae bacterium]|nr:hypothetical protein [Leptospiraceae bacterium]